jgi:hypothetical protein
VTMTTTVMVVVVTTTNMMMMMMSLLDRLCKINYVFMHSTLLKWLLTAFRYCDSKFLKIVCILFCNFSAKFTFKSFKLSCEVPSNTELLHWYITPYGMCETWMSHEHCSHFAKILNVSSLSLKKVGPHNTLIVGRQNFTQS